MKFVGIDWAQQFHDVALVDDAGTLLDQWRSNHDAAGVTTLLERLDRAGGPPAVLVALESGAPLLLDQLLDRGYTVYLFNPKQADRYRDRHTAAGAKDDRRDAFVLADAIRTDRARMQPIQRDSELAEEIRLRDRARTRKLDARTRFCNQLRQVLGRYFPAILGLDREMHDGFFLELLEAYPDPRTAAAGRMPRLERILREHRIRAVTAEDLAVRLRAPALKAPNYVLDACRDEALDLVAQIKLLNAQLATADEQLDELLERHPDRELLQSLPGIAERLSVRVVAEAGDRRDRFEDRSSFQSIAGTAPVTRRSGKRGVMSITMRKGCNRVLQAAMFNMARCSLPASGWARAFYDHARAHGMRHAAAVRALSNKWAKILWAILRDRKPYDEAAHVERLRAKGVPWAKQITGGEVAACPA